jgi:hypothetical protein
MIVFSVVTGSAYSKDGLQKEVIRIRKLMEESAKREIPETKLGAEIYKNILLGNRNDYQVNLQRAATCKSQREEALRTGQHNTAAKLLALSKLFSELADNNRLFVVSYRKKDRKNMDLAQKNILETEAKIVSITNKEVPRDWWFLSEIVAAMKSGN